MQENTELTEKEIIIKHLNSSKNIKEVAEKCGFTIATLYNRIEEYDINDYKFKGKQGGRKVAKLG
jgi:DNA-binding NtrC family response regulator